MLKFRFECVDGRSYIFEADSYADAKERFAAMGWSGEVPKVVAYRVFRSAAVPSILGISLVA